MTIMGLLKDEFTQTKTFCSFPLAHMMIKVVFLCPKNITENKQNSLATFSESIMMP